MSEKVLEKLGSAEWHKATLLLMTTTAISMGLNAGVAAICVRVENGKEVWDIRALPVSGKFHREGLLAGSHGANYYGDVMGMMVVMLRTMTPSGTEADETLKLGESRNLGGLCVRYEGYEVFVAFSGGNSDINVELAEAGLSFLLAEYI